MRVPVAVEFWQIHQRRAQRPITGSLVGLAFLVRQHYRRFQFATTMLNLLVEDSVAKPIDPTVPSAGRTAVHFVNHYDG